MAKASNLTPEAGDDLPVDALEGPKLQKRWVQEIAFYETKSRAWMEKGRKILRRYKDDRSPRDQRVPRFNILWSNVQTLMPALYSRKPKPDIERRFRDKDAVGRFSSQVLERSISYFMGEEFDASVRQAVLDRLLPGRGTVWVRYEPHFKTIIPDEPEEVQEDGTQLTDDVESYGESSYEPEEPQEVLADEVICFDYVHWEDFGNCFGRTWDEVPAVWRKVYLTREKLQERFGDEIGSKVILDYSPHDLKDNKYNEIEKKATIYEIWCKEDKKVYWIHKDYQEGPLDEKDDPLNLSDFWPCPRPLYATLGNDDMLPVPDYIEYQDQAHELDELTSRIGAITKAVKVAGVYDASAAGVERILAEGIENQLVPVNQWSIFGEKGGLKGVMDLLPMQDILQTLLGLYEARDKVKQDLYEITGIADIIRGASDANETATAQKIKGQFGTLRLNAAQDEVQRFVRDLVKIGTEIIAEHFTIDTIKKISGIKLLTTQEKQQYSMIGHNGGPPMQGAQPQIPQGMDAEEFEELMKNPTWEEIEQLLENENLLAYRVDIETDSTIKFDQDAERQNRVEFLQAMGSFIREALQVPAELAPLAAKMMQFGMRGFKVGKELESAFEIAINKLEKKAQDPQQKPDPETVKAQMTMEVEKLKAQTNMQVEQFKSQQEQARLQMQAAVDKNQAQLDLELEQHKATLASEMEMAKTKMDNETKIIVAQIQAKTSLQTAAMSAKASSEDAENEAGVSHINMDSPTQGPTTAQLLQTVTEQLTQAFSGLQQSHATLAQAVSRPKEVVRDEQGKVIGVR